MNSSRIDMPHHKWTQRLSLGIILSCLLLSACGQKGPLYLPGQHHQAAPETTAPEPAEQTQQPVTDAAPETATPAPETSAPTKQ